jgi:hypothetical protein
MSSIFNALKKLEGEKSADRSGGLKGDIFRPPPPGGGGKRIRSALIGVAVLLLGGGAALLWSRSAPEPPVEAEAPDQPVSVGAGDAAREEARTAGAEGTVSAADRARREQLLTRYRALRERREGGTGEGELPAGSPRLVEPSEGLLSPPIVAFPIHEKPAAEPPSEPSPSPQRIVRAPAASAPEVAAPEKPPAPAKAAPPEAAPAPSATPPVKAAPPEAAPAPAASPPAKAAPPEAAPAPEVPAAEAAAPEAPAPSPPAPQRVARAKSEPPGAAPEVPPVDPAPAAPEVAAPDAPPPPLVVESAGPRVTLTEVTFHSSRDRRSAYLGIEVREILPGAVIVVVAGHEVTLDVGESVSLTVTRPDFH